MNGLAKAAILTALLSLTACTFSTPAPGSGGGLPSGSSSSGSGSLAVPPDSPVVEEDVVVEEVVVEEVPVDERSEEQRQEDVEACYAYAQARVKNESQIDNDINAGRGIASLSSSQVQWTQRTNNYYYKQEQSSLFESCMRSKGYSN